MDLKKEALEMHKKNKGKLSVNSKIRLDNKEVLSLAYSPGVAEPCKEIYENKEKVYDYTIKANSVAVVTDGSSVLGLGNIGASASIPVMEGKAALFKEFAGIDAFPICIDSQDVKKIIETVKLIAPVFGGINLEDIKAPECFEVEKSLMDIGIPVMHDDQHGTAVVVLAAMINVIKLKKISKEEIKIVINGVGAAGIAIAKILLSYGFKKIIMSDSKGVIYKGRKDLNEQKKEIAELTNVICHEGLDKKDCSIGNLENALNGADVFIGVSKGNLIDEKIVKSMSKNPVIFALANPVPEIMPDKAKQAGAFIIATGRSDFENQINNVLAFPGIFKGALDIRAKKITEKMKIAASIALAELIKEPNCKKIIPEPFDKRVVEVVSEAVKKAYLEDYPSA